VSGGPVLRIRADGIAQNHRTIRALAEKRGIRLSVVTKGLCGDLALVRLLAEGGADSLCEARVDVLKRFAESGIPAVEDAEKWLIRAPLPSEAEETVRYADVSLNTERATLEALSAVAESLGRVHKVVLMVELGELREGVMPEDLAPLCEAAEALPGLRLHGIGANLSCNNEIVPDARNMAALAEAARAAEAAIGRPLDVVSGGSSSAVRMLEEGALPRAVGHLRIGEAILLGNIVCYDVPYQGAVQGNFILEAEVIESLDKPVAPWGSRVDAEAGAPAEAAPPPSAARARRVLVAAGYQDADLTASTPLDPGIRVLGATSDCTICDAAGSPAPPAPGDTLRFSLKYHAMVQAMAADSVEKVIVRG